METISQNSQTIRTSKSEGLAEVSKFRSCVALFQRLRPHLFLLSQSLWLLGLVALWRTFSSQLYEAFQSLPVIDQYVAVAAASVFCFLFAATVREFRTDFGERWAARIVGACGVAVMLSFSFRMTIQVDQLKSQIASKEISSARQIATTPSQSESGPQGAPTPANGIAAWASGTSVTYDIGRARTITITEPWRWCADRSMFGEAERIQCDTGGHRRVERTEDGNRKRIGREGRFAAGAVGDSGSVQTGASGAGSASPASEPVREF
jgi:hypothetical protein